MEVEVASWNWNSVSPVGVFAPALYFETNPKLALPLTLMYGMPVTIGDMIHPPPVTNPPFGS